MELVAGVLAAILAAAVVVFVARPFLREPEAVDDSLTDLSDEEKARIRLLEDRDRGLAALKELEFDHRTGKISTEDYEAQVSLVRGQAAAVIQALDDYDGRTGSAEAAGAKKQGAREATSTHPSRNQSELE